MVFTSLAVKVVSVPKRACVEVGYLGDREAVERGGQAAVGDFDPVYIYAIAVYERSPPHCKEKNACQCYSTYAQRLDAFATE